MDSNRNGRLPGGVLPFLKVVISVKKSWIWLASLALGGLVSAQTIVTALPPQTRITYLLPIPPATVYTLYNSEASELLYRPLLWVDHNIQIDYSRSIAKSVSTPDGQHYTIALHRHWKWSDGKPVTSADVVFALKLLMSISANNAQNYGGWGIGGIPNAIKQVSADGPYTVKITLDNRYNEQWFLYNGLAQIIPLPEHAWNKYPNDPAKTLAYLQKNGDNIEFFKNSPVDGPFMVNQFVNNQSYSFVANPNYSGHKPSYHELILRYFTTSDAEYNALRTGEVQVGYLPFHLIQNKDIPGYRFASYPQWAFEYIYVNFANPERNGPALKELPVRQALQMAVDQPAMIKVLFHGQAIAQYGPVPYDPPTYLSPYLKTHVPYPYDPAKGKAILEKAGWHMENGVMTKGNLKLEFTLYYSSGNTTQQEQAELIAESAAKEGIKLTLKPEPFDTLLGLLNDPKKWSLVYYGGWIYQPDYYPTGYGLFNSQGGSNQQGFNDPQMDVYTILTHAFFPSKAQSLQALYRYEDYAAKILPVIYLPQSNTLAEISDQISGYVYNPTGNWSPEYWSIK